MMSGVRCVTVCLWLGLLIVMTAGNSSSLVDGGSVLAFIINKFVSLELNQKTTQKNLEATEKKLQAIEKKMKANEAKLEATNSKLEATETKLEATETKLEATESALQSAKDMFKSKVKSGSTFVRWGRKTCTNSSKVVYTGVAGGSYYTHTGAAVDLLCLTMVPQFDATTGGSAFLFGAEYEHISTKHNQDVPCSVCRTRQSTTIMVPATHTCPQGWTTQYTGHLVAGHYGHKAATQYNCLDGTPENMNSGQQDVNGRLLYYTKTRCGSLPCPPYINDKVVLCVVCSK